MKKEFPWCKGLGQGLTSKNCSYASGSVSSLWDLIPCTERKECGVDLLRWNDRVSGEALKLGLPGGQTGFGRQWGSSRCCLLWTFGTDALPPLGSWPKLGCPPFKLPTGHPWILAAPPNPCSSYCSSFTPAPSSRSWPSHPWAVREPQTGALGILKPLACYWGLARMGTQWRLGSLGAIIAIVIRSECVVMNWCLNLPGIELSFLIKCFYAVVIKTARNSVIIISFIKVLFCSGGSKTV